MTNYDEKLFRAFVFMNLMDAFHDHDHVYLENIEHDGYSTLLDEDKKHVLVQLKSEIDRCLLHDIQDRNNAQFFLLLQIRLVP